MRFKLRFLAIGCLSKNLYALLFLTVVMTNKFTELQTKRDGRQNSFPLPQFIHANFNFVKNNTSVCDKHGWGLLTPACHLKHLQDFLLRNATEILAAKCLLSVFK